MWSTLLLSAADGRPTGKGATSFFGVDGFAVVVAAVDDFATDENANKNTDEGLQRDRFAKIFLSSGELRLQQ